jgi:hypothetical protein
MTSISTFLLPLREKVAAKRSDEGSLRPFRPISAFGAALPCAPSSVGLSAATFSRQGRRVSYVKAA